jgi:hypothetical protein
MCGCLVVNCSPTENRFNAVASHPVDRMIRVHAKSLAHAKHCNRCDETAPAACESDARNCRIVINALRREIDRLLRGIDPRRPFWVETQANRPSGLDRSDSFEHAPPEIDFAQRSSTTPSYAPPSIGDRAAIMQMFSGGTTSTPTNPRANQIAGQLIDVLA